MESTSAMMACPQVRQGSVAAVQEFLWNAPEDPARSLGYLEAVVDDIDELTRRLGKLRELSTRYSQVTFSPEVAGLVKMVGKRVLVEAL